jgi:protein HIRA/HIR1
MDTISRNIKLQRSHISPVSIQPLFSLPSSTILSATLRPGGSPVLLLSSGIAFSYDPALSTWLKVSEARWSQGSDAWEGKQRATAVRGINNSKGIISSLESSISDLEISDEAPGMPLKNPSDAPAWWNAALTLGHLETRLHSAKLLDSPSEYRNSLIIYAKRIAEEGFRGKAEELLKELCGPIYW